MFSKNHWSFFAHHQGRPTEIEIQQNFYFLPPPVLTRYLIDAESAGYAKANIIQESFYEILGYCIVTILFTGVANSLQIIGLA